MWSKGSKCTSGEVCFCHCCYWDAGIEILCSIFPPLPTAVAVLFLLKKKKKAKREIYCTPLIDTANPSSHVFFFSFLSDWSIQKRKSSSSVQMMVRIFIDRFFFPPVKLSHLEIKQLHLALLTYCENCKTFKYNLVNFKPAVAICHPQWIVQLFFQASLYFFLTWGHTKTKK